MTGTELRQWRLAHGLTPAMVAQRVHCRPRWIGILEDGRRPVSPRIAAYAAAYPPAPRVPTYPLTGAGLDAAIRAQWPTFQAWALWWGCTPTAAWAWRRGVCALPPDVYRWLWEGAPYPWPPRSAPPPLEVCLVCGDTPLHARGRCYTCYQYHYRTQRDRGPLLLHPNVQPPCRVCGGPSHSHRFAWCHRCYMRAWRQQRAVRDGAGEAAG